MTKAYWIAQISIKDEQKFAAHLKLGLNQQKVEEFGGIFLARGDKYEMLEGSGPDRLVLIEFPSLSHARSFYRSTTFQASVASRSEAADVTIMLIEAAS